MIDKRFQASLPVYVEIDEQTSVITEVLIPLVSTVERLESDERGNVRAYLHEFSTIRVVLKSDDDFETMRDSLQAALDDGSERMITSTRYSEIIDVRLSPIVPAGSAIALMSRDIPTPVTLDEAINIFNDMKAESCTPCSPSSTCIPFRYAMNGCQYRAHLMAYKMQEYPTPVVPVKTYIEGTLDPFAPNDPGCGASWNWGWHIAPSLVVTLPGGEERRVIDPSLAEGPVSVDDWTTLNKSCGSLHN